MRLPIVNFRYIFLSAGKKKKLVLGILRFLGLTSEGLYSL